MAKRNNRVVHQKPSNQTSLTQPQLRQVTKTTVEHKIAFRQELYSGPLPHPETLARYDQIVPGSAERIISVFEKQVDHRHKLENKFFDQRASESKLGTACITVLAIVLIGSGTFLVFNNKEVTGMITSLSGLLPIAFGYIRGKMIQSQNLSKKEK